MRGQRGNVPERPIETSLAQCAVFPYKPLFRFTPFLFPIARVSVCFPTKSIIVDSSIVFGKFVGHGNNAMEFFQFNFRGAFSSIYFTFFVSEFR